MLSLPSRHPALEVLSEFADATATPEDARTKTHLAGCARCRRLVQHFRAVRTELILLEPPAIAVDLEAVRNRVLTSRAAGSRAIIPVESGSTPRSARPMWANFAVGTAAVTALLLGDTIWSARHDAEASSTTGTLVVMPAMPRAGEALELTYTPSASLARYPTLAVRARLRTSHDREYESGIPVRTIGELTRGRDGRYTARVTFPDSVVFAAIAVEDSTGSVIDSNDKRAWEVFITEDGTHPTLAALDQRTNDLMGRSFEEGYATAHRMVALYPDSLQGWNWLGAFESWMGIADVDSLRLRHRATLTRLDRMWRDASHVPDATLGRLTWYARVRDSTIYAYWRDRLMREAPTDGFALHWRILDTEGRLFARHDTVAALRTFDSLWIQRTVDRASEIADAALAIAIDANRPELASRWATRSLASASEIAPAEASIGERFARQGALATDGMERMRHAVASAARVDVRRLMETSTQRDLRLAGFQRRTLASLGRALIATGEMRAGLDTLSLAGNVGWDLQVIRALRTGSFAAGDSATGWAMTARLVADPSTSTTMRESLIAQATRALGAREWNVLRREGARVFAQRILEGSQSRSLPSTPRLRDATGREQTLRSMVEHRITIVAFWSRFCGWALEDLENLNEVASELDAVGAQLVLVLSDETAPTPELTSFLADRKVRPRVWFDVSHTTSKAFNNWGTPRYYVLDGNGRVRFGAVTSAKEALVRAEALRLADADATR